MNPIIRLDVAVDRQRRRIMKLDMLIPFSVLGLFLFSGCVPPGSGPTGKPDPFVELYKLASEIEDNGGVATVGTGSGKSLDKAKGIAKTEAFGNLSEKNETRVGVLSKRFVDVEGEGMDQESRETWARVIKTVSSSVIKGVSEWPPLHYKDSGLTSAGFLLYISPKKYAKSLEDELRSQARLYNRYIASEAHKELDKEVKAFEEWKEKNLERLSEE